MIRLLLCLALLGCFTTQGQSIEHKVDSVCKAKGLAPFTTKLIIAQAKFESGNFTNRLTVKYNNLFGMKRPRVRPTMALKTVARAEGRNGYARFSSVESCVEDLYLYLSYHKEVRVYKTTEEYVTMLKKHRYFESSKQGYVRGLKFYLK